MFPKPTKQGGSLLARNCSVENFGGVGRTPAECIEFCLWDSNSTRPLKSWFTHYLSPKVLDTQFHALTIREVNLSKCEPWVLALQVACEFMNCGTFYRGRTAKGEKTYWMAMHEYRLTGRFSAFDLLKPSKVDYKYSSASLFFSPVSSVSRCIFLRRIILWCFHQIFVRINILCRSFKRW